MATRDYDPETDGNYLQPQQSVHFKALDKDKDYSPDSNIFRTQADFSLVNQLLKNARYKIPEHLREQVVNQISSLMEDSEIEVKTKLTAINTLVQMDKANIELIKLAMPKKIEHFNVKGLTDEKLLEAVEEVLKLLPRPINQQVD